MSGIKKIMVALAFGDTSREVFSHAANLAQNTDAELIVASVINERDVIAVERIVSMGYEVDGSHYIDGVVEERKAAIHNLIKDYPFPEEKLQTAFRVGNPADELLKLIIEKDVDMVVMGTRAHTDIEHVFIGSVADKVFRRSPVTVVSYRPEKQARRLRKRIHRD